MKTKQQIFWRIKTEFSHIYRKCFMIFPFLKFPVLEGFLFYLYRCFTAIDWCSCAVQFRGWAMPLFFMSLFFSVSFLFITSYGRLRDTYNFLHRLWMLPCYIMTLTLGKEMQEAQSLMVMFRRMFWSLFTASNIL